MTSNENGGRREDGFELQGEFYRWKVTDTGKDLMLIDRFSGMPVTEFFETVEDSFDRGRAPILLALMATSIRAKNPDWSVERITRLVMGASLGDVTFVDADEEETDTPPPAQGGQVEEQTVSTSPPAESSHSATHPESSISKTSSGTRH